MKRRIHLFLALFFAVSTLTAGLHELMPHHDSSNCQVCTLVQNDNGLAPDNTLKYSRLHTVYEPVRLVKSCNIYRYISNLQARAPPSFS